MIIGVIIYFFVPIIIEEVSFVIKHIPDYMLLINNKIEQIKENTKEDTWSDYDRRIETKLYL